MRKYKKVKPEDVPAIMKLRSQGVSQKAIAKALGLSQANVSRLIRKGSTSGKTDSTSNKELRVVPNLERSLEAIAEYLGKLVELQQESLQLDGLRYKAQKEYHEKREAQYQANKERFRSARSYFTGGESWN